ncbi:MAG: hypothetical protein IPN74_01985 [Haliscomenobacter sp.]|nr:hypothetical protein [Haliscomenobacter sp.]MBK8877347.1 hypothetical protein [Haliscomenobacter sp.]
MKKIPVFQFDPGSSFSPAEFYAPLVEESARDQYTAGNARIRVGCLSPGFCLIARGRDFQAFNQTNAFFYPAYGKLIPADVAPETFLSPSYQGPFAHRPKRFSALG